jgi:hypothetical protein
MLSKKTTTHKIELTDLVTFFGPLDVDAFWDVVIVLVIQAFALHQYFFVQKKLRTIVGRRHFIWNDFKREIRTDFFSQQLFKTEVCWKAPKKADAAILLENNVPVVVGFGQIQQKKKFKEFR